MTGAPQLAQSSQDTLALEPLRLVHQFVEILSFFLHKPVMMGIQSMEMAVTQLVRLRPGSHVPRLQMLEEIAQQFVEMLWFLEMSNVMIIIP